MKIIDNFRFRFRHSAYLAIAERSLRICGIIIAVAIAGYVLVQLLHFICWAVGYVLSGFVTGMDYGMGR